MWNSSVVDRRRKKSIARYEANDTLDLTVIFYITSSIYSNTNIDRVGIKS